MELQLHGVLGLIVLPGLAWLMSENRQAFGPAALLRLIVGALALQLIIAGLLLNIPMLRILFDWMAGLVSALQGATNAGMRLVFGYLAGGPTPFDVVKPQNSFVLAFQALPLILVISALSRLLYYWGVLQKLVGLFAWGLRRTLGVSGPVGTAAAANIFVGMVESPLLIKPYLARMSRSDLFAVMTTGMATVAGTVLVLYATILGGVIDGAAGHLIVASVISAPAALMLARLMVPETADDTGASDDQERHVELSQDIEAHGSVDAIAQGTRDGLALLASVAAMLIVFVSLVALSNQILSVVMSPFGLQLSIEQILGWLFAPLAWLIGIPASEAVTAGSLLGTKTVLNEFIAYLELAKTPADALSPHSRLILTYALCGFANFGSLGIMIGGLVAMVPERRSVIASLGLKTIIAGTLATLMTGAVVGVISPFS